MAQTTKTNGSLTVYSLRRAAGMPAHRPSAFNACVGAALKGQKFSAPPGMGGRHNKALHAAFSAAVRQCSGRGGRPSRREVSAAEARFLRETERGG